MKKLNKKTINKLNELILRSYPVSKDEITDEHWALEKKLENDKDVNNMWKDENGKVYTEEDLFNIALEECYSEESAYNYIDTLIMEKNLEEI